MTEDDAVRTRASSGKPMRLIKSQWSAEWEAPGDEPAMLSARRRLRLSVFLNRPESAAIL